MESGSGLAALNLSIGSILEFRITLAKIGENLCSGLLFLPLTISIGKPLKGADLKLP